MSYLIKIREANHAEVNFYKDWIRKSSSSLNIVLWFVVLLLAFCITLSLYLFIQDGSRSFFPYAFVLIPIVIFSIVIFGIRSSSDKYALEIMDSQKIPIYGIRGMCELRSFGSGKTVRYQDYIDGLPVIIPAKLQAAAQYNSEANAEGILMRFETPPHLLIIRLNRQSVL